MGTIDKALALLRLFTAEKAQWTVEAAAGRLGIPTSTAYRYFRSLTKAGLIVDFSAGRYVIGPGVIELDRLARRTDPLIVASQPALDELARGGPKGTMILLSRIYRRRVMCVDQRFHGHRHVALSFERGRPMPLVRGSPSRAILAYLPARTLTRVYEEDHAEIAQAGLGSSQKAFRNALREIRRAGFVITRGEVDRGVIGVSAPIFGPENDAFASISFVIPDTSDVDPTTLASTVKAAAASISAELHKTDYIKPL